MNPRVTELVKDVGNLITLPEVFILINRLVEDPNSSITDIAKIASHDPSFSVRLLRVANSPFYGLSSTVDTVSKAVSIIGTSQIRSLALATSVAKTFEGLPNSLVSMQNFWKHSLYTALIARVLAKKAKRLDPDAVFTAALLHDIGELVIFNRMSQQAKESLQLVLDSADELPVYLAEQQIMGFDHAMVGGELARKWALPRLLEECIEFHHDIQAKLSFPREVALVHIANILALMAEVHTLDLSDVSPIDPIAWKTVGLEKTDVINEVIEEAQQEFSEAEKLFLGN